MDRSPDKAMKNENPRIHQCYLLTGVVSSDSSLPLKSGGGLLPYSSSISGFPSLIYFIKAMYNSHE